MKFGIRRNAPPDSKGIETVELSATSAAMGVSQRPARLKGHRNSSGLGGLSGDQ